MSTTRTIERHALRISQSPTTAVLLFSLTGEEIHEVAEVSRVARDESDELIGYQRGEVRRHVKNIVEYLDSGDVLFPNSLILALTTAAKFTPAVDTDGVHGVPGLIRIPVPTGDTPRPGWIVDGQQRSIALAKAERQALPVPVTAFITDDVAVQREQFLRINSVRPLPSGLITELLPTIDNRISAKLETRKAPSMLCDRLAREPTSPFCGLIRRPSTPKEERKDTVVKDTSLVASIQDSLTSPSGCLFAHQNIATGEVDLEAAWLTLKVWWTAVRDVFSEAWGQKPRQSRLMHSAGIRVMGRLSDRIMPGIDVHAPDAVARVRAELMPLQSACCWTTGQWDVPGELYWNEVQCVERHVRLLTHHLADLHARAFAVLGSERAVT